MKIVAASDWRDSLEFDTPLILASVMPGDDTRCSVCGGSSPLRPRSELWAVKHRHPKHHDGHVRFYCADHVPAVAPAPVQPAQRGKTTRAPRTGAASSPRRPAASDRPTREMCPNCFVEVSASGECGMCGWTAA